MYNLLDTYINSIRSSPLLGYDSPQTKQHYTEVISYGIQAGRICYTLGYLMKSQHDPIPV